MDITDATDLHVELNVFEDDMPLIRIGQRIRFRLANAPDKWMEAKIFLIGNNVRSDRSVTIHGHLNELNEDLIPGLFINAAIEVGTEEHYVIPETGIVHYQDSYYVYKFSGKKNELGTTLNEFEMIEIKVGKTEEGYTAISPIDQSLDVGKLDIVTHDAFTLLAKAKNTKEEGGGHGH